MPSTTTTLATQDLRNHTLTKILERPVIVASGTLPHTEVGITLTADSFESMVSSGDEPGKVARVSFPAALGSHDVIREKMSNFMFMRADLEVMVKVNATPFQQGVLILVYQPYQEELVPLYKYGSSFLAGLTSYPHKILNFESSNSTTLVVPFVNEYDYFNLSTPDGLFGTVTLYNLAAPADSTDSPVIHFTMFARLVNPILKTPSTLPLSEKLDTRTREEKARVLARQARRLGFEVDLQVGTEDTEPGPVTKIASTVSSVSDALSGVPVIGNIAKPVSWVSRVVGKVASIFGWSKPVNLASDTPVQRIPARGYTNFEGYDACTTLAAISDNAINIQGANPSPEDEMTISYIVQRSNVITRFDIDVNGTQNAAGNIFFNHPVCPIQGWMQATGAADLLNLGSYSFGTFSYISACAEFWRGEIVYTLEAVKTAFHSGRILVQYIPWTATAEGLAYAADINEVYSMIIDLSAKDGQTANKWEIPVPYISETPWKNTVSKASEVQHTMIGYDGSYVKMEEGHDTYNGRIVFSVLTPLVCPDTVNSHVTFFLSHKGGKSFELACPVTRVEPGFVSLVSGGPGPEVRLQGGFDEMPIDTGFIPCEDRDDVTENTIGEYFLSLRSYIKRFDRYLSSVMLEYLNLTNLAFQLTPFQTQGSKSTTYETTPLLSVAPLFRFWGGSMRLKHFVLDESKKKVVKSYLNFQTDAVADSQLTKRPQHTTWSDITPVHEIQVPFYSQLRCRVVGKQPTVSTSAVVVEGDGEIYTAAGDDFSFFFLVGPPVCRHVGSKRMAPKPAKETHL